MKPDGDRLAPRRRLAAAAAGRGDPAHPTAPGERRRRRLRRRRRRSRHPRRGGRAAGVEAVVDKDLASAVLAEALDADVLLVVTDVPHVDARLRRPRGRRRSARDAGRLAEPRLRGRIDGPQGRRGLPVRRAHGWDGGHRLAGRRRSDLCRSGRHHRHPQRSLRRRRSGPRSRRASPRSRPAEDPQRADACWRLVRARRRDPPGRTRRRRRRRGGRGWSPDRRASGR